MSMRWAGPKRRGRGGGRGIAVPVHAWQSCQVFLVEDFHSGDGGSHSGGCDDERCTKKSPIRRLSSSRAFV